MRRLPTSVALVMLTLASACVTVTPPRFMRAAPDREWAPTLDRARTLADAGQGDQADSLLASYARAYPSAPQSLEVNYWRALFSLRSPAAVQNSAFAMPLLQTYLAAGPSTAHRSEADALLRAVARLDTLSRAAATYVSHGDVTPDAAKPDTVKLRTPAPDTKAQDEEIKRLKDELAKSKDELDRIKKRLAEPGKKPPA